MRFLGKNQEKSLGSTSSENTSGSAVQNWFCRKAHPFYSKGLFGNTDIILISGDLCKLVQT